MGKRKTAKEYGEDITDLHYRLEDLIKRDQEETEQFKKLSEEISRKKSKWAERLDIVVFIANNEQRPWTEDMIKYITAEGEVTVTTASMPTKKESGYGQVGDYNFIITDYDRWGGLVVERKSKEDLYQTLFSRDENGNWQRERFYREIERYQADGRFKRFAIFAECDQFEWMTHVPRFDPETKKYNHAKEDTVNTTQKRAAIAGLIVNNTPVIWAGSPKAAAILYAHMIRQYCRQNYGDILGLKPATLAEARTK